MNSQKIYTNKEQKHYGKQKYIERLLIKRRKYIKIIENE